MESALFAIRQCLPDLPSAERRAAEYVLSEPGKVLHCNITELARRSGVSQAAIVRFCRRIGTSGFADFKLRLSRDVFLISPDEKFLTGYPESAGRGAPSDLEAGPDMDPAKLVKGIIGGIQRNLARLEIVCDIHLLIKAADLIRGARFIGLFGIGASGLAAQDLYQKFLRIGLPCSNSQDTDLQITTACNLRKGDAAFIISYSGETTSMIRCAEWARKNGASLITLTREGGNTLRSCSDIPLLVPSLEPVYRSAATVSRINQLAVVDMIYSLVISKDLNTAIEALERTMTATHSHPPPVNP
ncbi:MAG: MurR/RpiR family transcriptional regulator [Treponema sp.]|jgi:DNA-binding MurR/RpiR family transcriptional regulator|nr:MurR/RpiR family transcriptional regulator [Treponema sp.]